MKNRWGIGKVVFFVVLTVLAGLSSAKIPESVLDAIEMWEDLDYPPDASCLMVKYSDYSASKSLEAKRLEVFVRQRFAVEPLASRSESLVLSGYKKFDCSGLSSEEREELIEMFRTSSVVDAVDENQCVENLDTPNDPMYPELWGMDAIQAREGWGIATDSRKVIIAVVDTGIDYLHEDLRENMWVNPGEVAGNGIDDDGNGFVDDVYGYDFGDDDPDIMDNHGHGTHVAGILGGRGDNGIGVAGVSWKADIMGVKVRDRYGYIYYDALVEGIAYAVEMGASVINLSLGGSWYNESLKNAISIAEDNGVVVVVAAGNSGRNTDALPYYPSCLLNGNILSVAASDAKNDSAYFSNFGERSVDIAAPGTSILSCLPSGQYGYLSGTSMASPHVAGAVALAMAELCDRMDPDSALRRVVGRVKSTTQAGDGFCSKNEYGGVLGLGGLLKRTRHCSEKRIDRFASRSFVTAAEIEIPCDGVWKIEYNVVSAPRTGGNARAEFWLGKKRVATVNNRSVTPWYVYPPQRLLQGCNAIDVNVAAGTVCRIKVRSLGGVNKLDLARIDLSLHEAEGQRSGGEGELYVCDGYTYWDTAPWYWVPAWDGEWQNVLYATQYSPEPGEWEFNVDIEASSAMGEGMEVMLVDGERGIWERVDLSENVSGRLSLHKRFAVSTEEQTAYLRVIVRCVGEIEVDAFEISLHEKRLSPVRSKQLCERVLPYARTVVCEANLSSGGRWNAEVDLAMVSFGGGSPEAELWLGSRRLAKLEGKTVTPRSVSTFVSVLAARETFELGSEGGEKCYIVVNPSSGPVIVGKASITLTRS